MTHVAASNEHPVHTPVYDSVSIRNAPDITPDSGTTPDSDTTPSSDDSDTIPTPPHHKQQVGEIIFRHILANPPNTNNRHNPYFGTSWGDVARFDHKQEIGFEKLVSQVTQFLCNNVVFIASTRTILKKAFTASGPAWVAEQESEFIRSNSHVFFYSTKCRVGLADVYYNVRHWIRFDDSYFEPFARNGPEDYAHKTEAGATNPVSGATNPVSGASNRVSGAPHLAGVDSRFNTFCCWAAQHKYETTPRNLDNWADEAVRLFFYHVKKVIANNSSRKTRHFVDWLTHIVQHPAIKTQKCIVIYGAHGGGKSVLFEFLVFYVFGKAHGEFFTRDEDSENRFTQDQSRVSLTVFEE